MRTEQLEYMLDLQSNGSISKTADKHLISHQAVSKSIKALENELSVILLDRSSQGVSLTTPGLFFCDFAKSVLDKRSELEQKISRYKLETKPNIIGNLAIYAVPRFITPSFLNFIEKMNLVYPKLHLTVRNATTEHFIKNIQFDDNMIFLLTSGFKVHCHPNQFPDQINHFIQDNNLQHKILASEELFACVHTKSPLSRQKIMTSAETLESPFVSFTYPFDDTAQSQFIIDGFEQQKNVIKAGNAFGIYTKKEFESFFSKQFTLIPLEDAPTLLFIAMYKAQVSNPLIDLFCDLLIQNIKF